jgi:photosystem II stability/assembly factor-like uncharacterized protein
VKDKDIQDILEPLKGVAMSAKQERMVLTRLRERMASEPQPSRFGRRRFRRSTEWFVLTSAAAMVALAAGFAVLHRPAEPNHPQPGITAVRPAAKISFSTIHMADPSNGWATSKGRVLRTSDGGKTWTDVTPPEIDGLLRKPNNQFARDLPLISVVNSSTAVVSIPVVATNQDNGATVYVPKIFRTVDGGKHWESSLASPLESPGSGEIPVYLHFEDANHGWLVSQVFNNGGEAVPYRTLFETKDGGHSWHILAQSKQAQTTANGHIGLLPGMNPQAGAEWVKFFSNGTALTQGQRRAGNTMDPASTALYRSTDGGVTWKRVSIYVSFNGTPKSVIYLEPGIIGGDILVPLVVTYDSPNKQDQLFIAHSQDGGKTFVVFTGMALKPVSGVLQDHFVGHLGSINIGGELYNTDGVSVAHAASLGDDEAVVQMLNEQNGYATIGNKLWITKDYGFHWNPVQTGNTP